MSAFSLDSAPPKLTLWLRCPIDAPLPAAHPTSNYDISIAFAKSAKTTDSWS